MESYEVTFGEESLKGTILQPPSNESEKQKAILILGGSGAINRDGNNPDQSINLYNQLAEALTKMGFVTLRYDKRGTAESGGVYLTTGLHDLIFDAKEAFRFLREQSYVDEENVFVIGHSEGAMLATEVAKDELAAGLIMLNGAGETLHESMVYQREKVIEVFETMTGMKKLLYKFLRMKRRVEKQGRNFDRNILDSDGDTLRTHGQLVNAKWFREHFAYDVKDSLKEITCPVLAIGGAKDLQSNPERAKSVKELVQGEVEVKIIPNMNHMMRHQEENFTIMQLRKAYKGLGEEPLSPLLLSEIENWLQKRRNA